MKKSDRIFEMLKAAFRFGIVGLLATAVHLAIATTALFLGIEVMLSNAIGFCTALFVSIIGHHHFSFPEQTTFWRGSRRFVPAAIVGFVANNVVLGGLVAATGNSHAWVKVAIAILVIPPATFGYAYFFAYRD
jgi:putative flippase GtrA